MAMSANLGRDTDHNSTKLVCDHPLPGPEDWSITGTGCWGRDPRKQKDFCITVKKRPKQKSHERWTWASDTQLLVQGSRIIYHLVPFNERAVKVIHMVQIEPKNGFETEKVKDGYRLCGYLPQPPTSPHIYINMAYPYIHGPMLTPHIRILYHTHTHSHTHTCTDNTHTHFVSLTRRHALSLSFSLSHTHTLSV